MNNNKLKYIQKINEMKLKQYENYNYWFLDKNEIYGKSVYVVFWIKYVHE
jgi:hypothetical protein